MTTPCAQPDCTKPADLMHGEAALCARHWREAAMACDHAAFYALDIPWRPLQECPSCEVVLRTITDAQGWADHWAEQRAEDKAYAGALLTMREDDARW